ncbi:hypothetical protein PULV_a0348 [Pseudoalteromonas ulvae UL12]|nr:hypothetical protein [Pseudoalteromonas ulvae UL12]
MKARPCTSMAYRAPCATLLINDLFSGRDNGEIYQHLCLL